MTDVSLSFSNGRLRHEIRALDDEIIRLGAKKDQAYLERNHLVAALARLFPSGVIRTNLPGWDPEWHGCVYIDLPSGQISYHFHDSQAHLFEGLPPYEGEWDGHDKNVVHARLAQLTNVANMDVLRPLLDEVEKLVTEVRRASAKNKGRRIDALPMNIVRLVEAYDRVVAATEDPSVA